MSYSLHVKSYNKRSLNLLVNSDQEHLVATRGTDYYLVAENKTDHMSRVSVSCNNKHVGSWELHPRSKLKIEEKRRTSFVFDSDNVVPMEVTSEPMSCEIYYISAMFEPGNITINIPVHLCDHHVNV